MALCGSLALWSNLITHSLFCPHFVVYSLPFLPPIYHFPVPVACYPSPDLLTSFTFFVHSLRSYRPGYTEYVQTTMLVRNIISFSSFLWSRSCLKWPIWLLGIAGSSGSCALSGMPGSPGSCKNRTCVNIPEMSVIVRGVRIVKVYKIRGFTVFSI